LPTQEMLLLDIEIPGPFKKGGGGKRLTHYII